jgi:hypothetical protein
MANEKKKQPGVGPVIKVPRWRLRKGAAGARVGWRRLAAWRPSEVQELRKLAHAGVSAERIAKRLGRSEAAVRSKARVEEIELPRHKRR